MSYVHARHGAVLLLIPILALTLTAGARAEELLPQAAPPAEAVTFAGMKEIPAGEFKMGIDEKALIKLYGDPRKNPTRKHHKLLTESERMIWWSLLLLETPEHDVELGPYALDIFTVTNAQYRQFLETSQKTSFFTRTKVNTIALVAAEVYGEEQLDAWKAESIFWVNEKKLLGSWEGIHKANEPQIAAILKEFNEFRPKNAWIEDFLLLPDKQRAEGWVQFLLPDGIALTVYSRPIPDHWLRPVPDEEQKKSKEYIPRVLLTKDMENWPVVLVSAEDADAFAEWAGKHVPTEQQYEKAARGPRGWLYPWGKTWDWSKERNFLVWRDADPEPKGPAAPYKDRPVDVTRCEKYASPYGMMHMLGNVREWTSSVPVLYPGSTAEKVSWYGSDLYRVLRSTSYGDGNTSGDGKKQPHLELMHRNTARALEGAGGAGISVTARYPAVGFRCAKYPEASRDILMLRQAAMLASGSLKEKEHGVHYSASRSYGIERNDYDASGGGNQTFVKGHTAAMGVVPIDQCSYSQAQELIAASGETDPTKGGPQMFAWIYWNSDLKVEILKEEIVQPEAPAEEGAGEGEAPAPEDGDAKKDDKKKDDKKKDKKEDKKKKKKDKKKRPGKKAPPEEDSEEPAGPQIVQTREFLAGHKDHPYFLGIVSGRLAIFEWKARGPELIGYLPVQGAAGQKEDAPAVVKRKVKEITDAGQPLAAASIDAEKGFVKFRITSETRSQSAKDVFVFDVVLKVQGSLGGVWRGF